MKKKSMCMVCIMVISVILAFDLSGCWNARELSDLPIVTGVGIDKPEAPGRVLLISQIVRPGEMKKPSKDSPGGEGKAYWNLKSEGATVFDAVREATHETGNKLYLAHTQVIVLGKDIAADGVRKYLDYFQRSHETRPTAIILVSRVTASEIFDVTPKIEKLPSMQLATLAKEQSLLTAHAESVNLQEFTIRLLSKTTSPIAPLVQIGGEGSEKSLHVEGMAVFKGDRLVGTLSPVETRGLLWVLGKVKSGDIDINMPEGETTLEIIKAESKTDVDIKDGKPYIHISIKAEGNLVNQTSPANLATIPGFSSLEQQMDNVIREEVQATLKRAKDMKTDIFAFGDDFHKTHRNEWMLMENHWDNIFPGLQVQVEVKSTVRAAGLIIKPAAAAASEGE